MSMHYRFPASTELNRRLPKETFYQRLNPTSALRQAFVTQVQEIIWRNKLAADTLNITEGGDYPELHVFDIKLKTGVTDIDVEVLRAIDSLIIFPIFYRITRRLGDTYLQQYQLAYKPPVVGGGDKIKLRHYFTSSWLLLPSDTELSSLPITLSITQLYRQLLQPLVGLRARVNEPLAVWIARLEDITLQEQRISSLQNKLRQEKQFNRKVELNRTLNELKQDLRALQAAND